MTTNTVLIYSGGLDSTVLLHRLLAAGDHVAAMSVDYGQRHAKEIRAARATCARLGVEHEVADLSGLRRLLPGGSQTDDAVPVPLGHYAAETMKATVVPNRNMVMLSVAAAWAIARKADRVAYAAHGGDHAIYPDCRPEFAAAIDMVLSLADWHSVTLHAPYLGMTKADIVVEGARLGVPFAETWSCYEGAAIHCGACGTCVERREAFALAGVPDPTPYREAIAAGALA